MNEQLLDTLEIKIANAKRLKIQIDSLKQDIELLKFMFYNCGNKELVGYSGRIDDTKIMGRVRLNDFACAKSVFELMIETGEKQFIKLQAEYEVL